MIINVLFFWHKYGGGLQKIASMSNASQLKVFIVDDDWFCRQLYHQHLLNLGIKDILLFDNGEDCLKNLDIQQPDMILLDYNMKPYNGLEVMKKIKMLYPGIYLLMISGQSDVQVAMNALQHGAYDYIIKGEHEIETIKKVTTIIMTVIRNGRINTGTA